MSYKTDDPDGLGSRATSNEDNWPEAFHSASNTTQPVKPTALGSKPHESMVLPGSVLAGLQPPIIQEQP